MRSLRAASQSRRRAAQTVSDQAGAHHRSVSRPAGPTDNQARWAAQQLNAALGQTFIADNRPGAGGVPGTEAVVKSAPDGYTLLAGNPGPLTIAPSARAQMPYDTLRDLAPIVLIAKSASCLCAHPEPAGERRQGFRRVRESAARAASTTARRASARWATSRPSSSRRARASS